MVSPEFCSGGDTGAWRTGSEVRGDKVIQKWKPSGILALGLQNLRAFANSRGHVPQCPMPDHATDAVDTREMKLFQNYFSLRPRLLEIILFQRVETCLKLFQSYFRGLLQLMNRPMLTRVVNIGLFMSCSSIRFDSPLHTETWNNHISATGDLSEII